MAELRLFSQTAIHYFPSSSLPLVKCVSERAGLTSQFLKKPVVHTKKYRHQIKKTVIPGVLDR